jgi:ABC-type multidrug transport system fused ATPase/permease subunit
MSDIRKVLRYLIPYKKEAIIATILLAFVVIADLSIPRLVQVIIDDGVAKGDMNDRGERTQRGPLHR